MLHKARAVLLLALLPVVGTVIPFSEILASDFDACGPESPLMPSTEPGLTLAFCAEWDPEFAFRGHQCCKAPMRRSISRRGNRNRCAPARAKASYCDEMTPEQRRYSDLVHSGQGHDVLQLIEQDLAQTSQAALGSPKQAFCSVNQGFLAWGRRLIPTEINRIRIRAPQRCVDFGTDPMVAMLEWVGRQIDRKYPRSEYPGVHLLVGDLSAPRGGCLTGRSGRRAHSSHTSGQDADLGFLSAQPGRTSPEFFSRAFDAEANWWLLKQIFGNPYACIKVVFLDRRLIRKVAKVAASDPLWSSYKRFVRHVPRHGNHFHVRVGEFPKKPGDKPGCQSDPELEVLEEEYDSEAESLDLKEIRRLPAPREASLTPSSS